jgi:ribosomal protein S6
MSEENNTSTEAEAERKIYEIGFHIVPSVPEDKLGAEVSSLKEILGKNGASIISEEAPKMRVLAYEMQKEIAGRRQKFSAAYFGWIKFESSPEGALAIDSAFKKNPLVLRYLIIKTVRENTMIVPKIPSYRKAEAPKMKERKETEPPEKVKVSELELDKAIDAAIGE